MNGVTLTPLRRIPTPAGDVVHGLRATDAGFAGFGEAYFSMVHHGLVKGWKRHRLMTLNLIVPCGAVQVSVHDEATSSTESHVLGPDDAATRCRLTIGPGLWVAFGGKAPGTSTLLNVASIGHDPSESTSVPLDLFPWSWLVAAAS